METQVPKFLNRLFGRTAPEPKQDWFNDDEIIPVPRVDKGASPEAIIRQTIAQFTNTPVEQVTDDMPIGPNGRSAVIGLVFTLGKNLFADTDTTVGDLIAQVREQS